MIAGPDTKLNEKVEVHPQLGTALVVFDYLDRCYLAWRTGPNWPDETKYVMLEPDEAERLALWRMKGAIESSVPHVHRSDRDELRSQWKAELVRQHSEQRRK